MPQIVAGVVLLQGAQAIPHAPIGEDHLEPEHQIARGAVCEHADAAGIGRQIAADLAAAFRGEAQRKHPSRSVRAGAHFAERYAGFDSHALARRIDVPDRLQAAERDYDLRPGLVGDLTADETRVSRLRHHADARRVGDRQDPRHLVRRPWPQHQRRLAHVLVAPLDEIRPLHRWVGERVR